MPRSSPSCAWLHRQRKKVLEAAAKALEDEEIAREKAEKRARLLRQEEEEADDARRAREAAEQAALLVRAAQALAAADQTMFALEEEEGDGDGEAPRAEASPTLAARLRPEARGPRPEARGPRPEPDGGLIGSSRRQHALAHGPAHAWGCCLLHAWHASECTQALQTELQLQQLERMQSMQRPQMQLHPPTSPRAGAPSASAAASFPGGGSPPHPADLGSLQLHSPPPRNKPPPASAAALRASPPPLPPQPPPMPLPPDLSLERSLSPMGVSPWGQRDTVLRSPKRPRLRPHSTLAPTTTTTTAATAATTTDGGSSPDAPSPDAPALSPQPPPSRPQTAKLHGSSPRTDKMMHSSCGGGVRYCYCAPSSRAVDAAGTASGAAAAAAATAAAAAAAAASGASGAVSMTTERQRPSTAQPTSPLRPSTAAAAPSTAAFSASATQPSSPRPATARAAMTSSNAAPPANSSTNTNTNATNAATSHGGWRSPIYHDIGASSNGAWPQSARWHRRHHTRPARSPSPPRFASWGATGAEPAGGGGGGCACGHNDHSRQPSRPATACGGFTSYGGASAAPSPRRYRNQPGASPPPTPPLPGMHARGTKPPPATLAHLNGVNGGGHHGAAVKPGAPGYGGTRRQRRHTTGEMDGRGGGGGGAMLLSVQPSGYSATPPTQRSRQQADWLRMAPTGSVAAAAHSASLN